MKFTVTTEDIQRLIIAMIYAQTDTKTIPLAWYDNAREILTQINKLCSEDNNYTLTVTVKEN